VEENAMLIVDAQVHIWSAGLPTNQAHRQVTSYSAEECVRDMDAAGVNACLLHPPGWDPNSGKISEEAAAKYPNRFGILGNFPVDKPENRSLIDTWRQRPGMLGLRYAFTQPHQATWMTDGTMDWLWPAAEKAGIPIALMASNYLPQVGRIAERHAGLKLIIDHYARVRDGKDAAAHGNQPALLALAKYPMSRSRRPARRAIRASPIPIATSTNTRSRSSRRLGPSAPSGAPTSPACRARGRNA
jgi:predicted TIM-barrel fold metal-dependent hydrolase